MQESKSMMQKIGVNRAELKRYGVKKIGLFGSYTRNEQKTESDVDILVEFEKDKKTIDNYMGLKFFIEDLFKRKVDLVVKEAIKPELKKYILESVEYA